MITLGTSEDEATCASLTSVSNAKRETSATFPQTQFQQERLPEEEENEEERLVEEEMRKWRKQIFASEESARQQPWIGTILNAYERGHGNYSVPHMNGNFREDSDL